MVGETQKMNREFLGKEYHSGPHLVEQESIRQYALATNEKNPLYLNTEPDAEILPPPIYPVVFLPEILSQLVDDSEEMGLDILRVVHAQHQMSWRNTVRPGDEINTTAKIINMEQRGINEILDLLIHCKRDDEIVVEMNYRLLARGEKKAEHQRTEEINRVSESRKVLLEQKSVVTADQGARYAEASGDHNPIHTSDEIARSVGLPRAILHGLCTMALASQVLVDGLLDGDPIRLKSMSVRFSKPVLLDQTLTTEVFEAGESEDRLQVVNFEMRDEKDVPVLVLGKAELSN